MLILVLALTAIAPLNPSFALERSPEEIRQQRQEIIDDILSKDSADDVAIDRSNCLAGQMPRIVERGRKSGSEVTPNAVDVCVAALMRSGADSSLLTPYQKLVADGKGKAEYASGLLGAIGGAVVEQAADKVSIGNGRAMAIDPAIAFDAGFTSAYLKGERSAAGMPDLATLKALSGTCLDRTQSNLGLCYATGYAHGVRAVLGEQVVVD